MIATTLLYGVLPYLIIGLAVIVLGPEGRKHRQDFKQYRAGSPAIYAELGMTQWKPVALWRCLIYLVFMTLLAAVLWPIFVPEFAKSLRPARRMPSAVPASWLIEQEESRHTPKQAVADASSVAFGHQHVLWNDLVASMREGDELWTYSSPPEDWEHLAGRAGIALVRGGQVIGDICTAMN